MVPGKRSRIRHIRSTSKVVLLFALFFILCSICYVQRNFSDSFISSESSKTKTVYEKPLLGRGLPDFTNGGIIVFYHIYKTGGSTVGKLLHEMSKKDQARFPPSNKSQGGIVTFEDASLSPSRLFFTMIRKNVDWNDDVLVSLDLAENKKKLILLELHVENPAPNFPSLVELAPTIEKWRTEASRRGVGFFAFTLVREPVAHALSFFNFFHVGNSNRPPPTKINHDFWNPFRPLRSTETNFLHSYYTHDRQCRMLSSDPQATRGAPLDLVWGNRPITTEDLAESRRPCSVEKVHDVFFNSLDWVGTTELLQNETLPLLTKLVANDPSLGRSYTPYKVFDKNPSGFKGMKKFDLSKKTMDAIIKRTKLDRELYAEVTSNFRLEDLGWDYYSPMDD